MGRKDAPGDDQQDPAKRSQTALPTGVHPESMGVGVGVWARLARAFWARPTIYLYAWFVSSLLGIWLVAREIQRAGLVPEVGEECGKTDAEEMTHMIALGAFGILILVQTSGVVFKVTPKKKRLSELMVFVNLTSSSIFASGIAKVFPDFAGRDGSPTQFLRCWAWAHNSSTLVVVVAALGSGSRAKCLGDSMVDWTLVREALAYNASIFLSGSVAMWSGTSDLQMTGIAFVTAASCEVKLFTLLNTIIKEGQKNVASAQEHQSLHAVQMMLYGMWSCFPMLVLLQITGILSYPRYEVLMCALDVFSQQSLCLTLLSGSFCLLETETPVHQIQLDFLRKADTTGMLASMNVALQTALSEVLL